jgi:N-acetylneuraminic acid mutarotase
VLFILADLFQTIVVHLFAILALIAFILACYATSQVNSLTNKVNSRPAFDTSIVLVSSPSEADSRGLKTLGSMYRGTGYWAPNSLNMAHPRSDHGAVNYQGNIYLFGGQSYNPKNTSVTIVIANMTRYNLYLNTVEEMSPMPEPRYRFGYAVVDDKLYVFGGFTAPEGGPDGLLGTGTLIYSFIDSKWITGTTSFPFPFPRPDLWGDSIGGKIYAAGGYNNTDPTYAPVTEVNMLDVGNGAKAWVKVANMKIPRGDHRIQASNGLLYAFGGVTVTGDGTCEDWYSCHPWTNSTEAYNPSTNTWTSRASMNWARGDMGSELLSNGHILTAGGESGYRTLALQAANEVAQPWVEEYDPTANAWISKSVMFEPRFRFDMASSDGHVVYAFGGAPSCDDNDPTRVCTQLTLSSVIGFYDNQYPDIWAATA